MTNEIDRARGAAPLTLLLYFVLAALCGASLALLPDALAAADSLDSLATEPKAADLDCSRAHAADASRAQWAQVYWLRRQTHAFEAVCECTEAMP